MPKIAHVSALKSRMLLINASGKIKTLQPVQPVAKEELCTQNKTKINSFTKKSDDYGVTTFSRQTWSKLSVGTLHYESAILTDFQY